MSSSTPKPLVIDLGGMWARFGYAGDDSPSTVEPAVNGYPKGPGIMIIGPDPKDHYTGFEAVAKIGLLNVKSAMVPRSWRETPPDSSFAWPRWEDVVRHGLSEDGMDAMVEPLKPRELSEAEKKRARYGWKTDLRVCLDGQKLLVTEFPGIATKDRLTMMEVVFEALQVSEFYAANSSACALLASGRRTGLVVAAGHQFTSAVAVHEGHALEASFQGKIYDCVSGVSVTGYLLKLLGEKTGHEIYDKPWSAERERVRSIKERLCYVTSDYQAELDKGDAACEREFVLPDGSKMTVGTERFRAPEILFRPDIIESDHPGIHLLAAKSIASCDSELQPILKQSVVLAGASTMFEGFPARMKKELSAEVPSGGPEVEVIAPVERKFSAWIGGSILAASLPDKSWITAKEYEGVGASIIQRKCF